MTNPSLVSRGSNDECWGTYNSDTKIGYGLVFEDACIHSEAIRISGDLPTAWYNYVLATAGTIIDKNTTSINPAANTTEATESICPRGWTLPNNNQINSNRNITGFSPVLGGNYSYGNLYGGSTYGFWWGSEAHDGVERRVLYYNGSSLYTSRGGRYSGFYIRCVPAP